MPNVPQSTPVYFLPEGIDRADGVSYGVGAAQGTPTSYGGLIANTAGGSGVLSLPINEKPDSPTIERAEQSTIVHRFTLSWPAAINMVSLYGRGKLVTDSGGNWYRVLSSSAQHLKGDFAELTITSEAFSYDNPPDEFTITPVKLGLDLLKHPRYFYALMPTNQIPTPWPSWLVADTDAQIAAKQTIIRAIQAYRENPVIPTAQTINNICGTLHDGIVASFKSGNLVYAVPNPNFKPQFIATPDIQVGKTVPAAATANGQPNPQKYYVSYDPTTDPNGKFALALAAAQEIIVKLWRMEDTPLLNGWEISWSSYYWRPVNLNPGSYIENPKAAIPPLPDYFTSPNWPADSSSVLDWIGYINPQCYSANGLFDGGAAVSWLRDADTMEYNRTWFKVTRKWIGAPVGAWDADLYNQRNRPTTPAEYNTFKFA